MDLTILSRECPECGESFDHWHCVGCGNPFRPTRGNQTRCKPRCRKSHGGRNKHAARDLRIAEHDVEFITVDGEGVTDADNDEHSYVLLTVGDAVLHRDGDRIDTLTILEFLWAQFELHPDAAFVGYYLGYDFSQWLRDLPVGRARALISGEGITKRKRKLPHLPLWPVDWGDWQLDMLGMRKLRLRRGNAGPWMTICDVGPFFQCSFLKAIDPRNWRVPIVTRAEFETIKAGKEGRGSDAFGPDMIRYNALECEILTRLMRDQNEGLVREGVRLHKNQWIGPGQVAQKWLRNIGAPKGELIRETVPDYFREAARAAYFGGWFEIFWHGLKRGTSYGYDINSAYPSIMARLPCLLHGKFSRGRIMRVRICAGARTRNIVCVKAVLKGSHPLCGAALHRRPDRTVLRPRETAGWFWLHEIEAAQAAGFIDRVDIQEWVSYTPCDCDPPLAPIAALYESRLAVGKNSASGKAKKLIYNSAYGKFAQSIGMPAFGNPVYASLITAGCRTMILDAIRTHTTGASSLLMVATDGVVFGEPHDALILDDARLGAWSGSEHRNLSLFMPGVYWDDAARRNIAATELKSRGISSRDLAGRLDIIDRAWPRWRRDGWPRLVIPVGFQLVSPRQALARGKWELCGSVVTDGQRVISADPVSKRVASGPGRSRPYGATPEFWSCPYEGTFGEEMRETDADEFGEHPDGPIGNVLMRELMGH